MLKHLNTIQNPPGGWKFKEERSGITFPLDGSPIASLPSVMDQIEAHRMGTGGDLNPGWEDRVIDEMCKQNPSHKCIQDEERKPRRVNWRDVKRFLVVLDAHIQDGMKHVPQEEAQRRENICMRCPMRSAESFCWGCKGMGKLAEKVLQGKHTENAATVGSCYVCGCMLKAKVWFPLEVLKRDGLEYPSYCWMSNPTEQTHQKS